MKTTALTVAIFKLGGRFLGVFPSGAGGDDELGADTTADGLSRSNDRADLGLELDL